MARTWMKDVVVDFLKEHGVKAQCIGGKKHEKVIFQLNGKNLSYSCGRSHSDSRFAVDNCRGDLRRILRREGIPM